MGWEDEKQLSIETEGEKKDEIAQLPADLDLGWGAEDEQLAEVLEEEKQGWNNNNIESNLNLENFETKPVDLDLDFLQIQTD